MKLASIFILAFLFVIGRGQKQEQASNQTDANRVEKVSIKVETAQCGMCATAIEEALEKVDGVQKAEVDLDHKVAKVQFMTAKATLAQLETAITKAGYDANEKKADPEAYDNLDECCKVRKK